MRQQNKFIWGGLQAIHNLRKISIKKYLVVSRTIPKVFSTKY